MITYYKNELYTWGRDENTKKHLVQIACLSTDAKPTENIANGSLCLVMDTGQIYAFDEEGGAWEVLRSSSSGGGEE